MASTYKSPGVYVEEITKFPPSVAQVETAIPAFIGYTEKAQRINPGDLSMVPTKIDSLIDFQQFFGSGHTPAVSQLVIDVNNVFEKATFDTKFHLYQSLQMFFNNGGGACYIISVGSYNDANDKPAYVDGLKKLKKADEPTLVLFPDAVLLPTHQNFYDLQALALAQCAQLGDRFCIFDLYESDAGNPAFDWKTGYQEFRDKIGMNDLKYGASYIPHLKVNLGIGFSFRDIYTKISRGAQPVLLENLTNDLIVKAKVLSMNDIVQDVNKIKGDIVALHTGFASLPEAFQYLIDKIKTTNTDVNLKTIIDKLYFIILQIDGWTTSLTHVNLKADIVTLIQNTLKTRLDALVKYENGAKVLLSATVYVGNTGISALTPPKWLTVSTADDQSIYTGSTNTAKRLSSLPTFINFFTEFHASLLSILQSAQAYEKEGARDLYNIHPVYKGLIDSLRNSLSAIPPSGAIAGIYAKVDNERGVWKAPANVSLTGVTSLTATIDNSDQEGLNIDTVAGKSINAIRAFSGKGILVWGARTLAGNDNEWRYISVRRFYNMVEESVRKSTERFVFEPNDAGTWVRVRAMIENFLTLQWRAGALAGAKPEDAFYVRVGLNQTMTALDILEGRMIVEIGMAVVRPAEFIILRFSHKMQES